jgi:hypothetical protein
MVHFEASMEISLLVLIQDGARGHYRYRQSVCPEARTGTTGAHESDGPGDTNGVHLRATEVATALCEFRVVHCYPRTLSKS